MKIERIGESRILLENPTEKFSYFGWPTVVRLKNGRIAVAASGFRLAHICPFGKAVLAFSDDEGETFTPPRPVIDTVLDDRDAGLCPFGKSGLIVTSFNNTVAFQRKHCIGDADCYAYLDAVTPEAEERALGSEFRISFDDGHTFGPIFHSPITSPHGSTELRDGRILWVGRVFSKNDAFTVGAPFLRVCEITPETGEVKEIGRIDDAFEEGSSLHFCEPHMTELPNGKLICHIRENKHFTLWQSVSSDGGSTWTKARPILGERGGSPAHLLYHSSGILLSAYGYRNEPYGIRVMASEDGGETWETDLSVTEPFPTSDLGYPATVELKDGSLLTVFYAPLSSKGPSVVWAQKWRFET